MARATDINYYIQIAPDASQVRVHVDSLKPHLGCVPQAWRGYEEESEEESSSSSSSDSTPSGHASEEEAPGEVELDPGSPEVPKEPTAPDESTDDSVEREDEARPATGRGARIRKPPLRMDL